MGRGGIEKLKRATGYGAELILTVTEIACAMGILGVLSAINFTGGCKRTGGNVLRVSLAAISLSGAAVAQAPGGPDGNPTVSWTAAAVNASAHGRKAIISVSGAIRDGWHVYGLKQAANGPTPLVVAVEKNEIAAADGAPAASAPTVAFEPAFGFVTPFYAHAFSFTVPVRLRAGLAPGRQLIPVSIRYQSCDGRVCLPPKTVHLTAPVDVRADS